jgi:hypothetical protein
MTLSGTKNTIPEKDLELETLTKKFLNGEITFHDYKEGVKKLELTHMDLRKAATKLSSKNRSDNRPK